MTGAASSERWRGAQAEALGRLERIRGGGEEIRPGDVLAFRETVDQAVWWMVLADGPVDGRWQLVAADLEPFVGSADVRVPPSGTCGAWTLRCRFPAWLPAPRLASATRAAVVDRGLVDEARRKCAALQVGPLTGGVLEEETDRETAYHDRIAEVEQAHRILTESSRPAPPASAVEAGRAAAPRRARLARPALALAAGVAAALGLGLLGGAMWQRQSGERRIADLEEQLSVARSETPPRSLPTYWLRPRDERDAGADTIGLEARQSHFQLILSVDDWRLYPGYPEYLLRIRDQRTGREVWSGAVTKSDVGVPVILSRGLLRAGDYRLTLVGVGDDASKPLAEYQMRLTDAAGPTAHE